ncbi:S1A family peptidase [Corallococcus coralloides]|uniref:S1A family peptidase n=1 Tax=Corallococcus coralloides TaxID=184914 RepID=A0A410RSE0_CORCK|nr:serine protease [Corallococcus coralloides]QAT84830.1 S1A family peptidase [Corallococcus coralloides]
MRFMSGVVVAVGLLGCGGSEIEQTPIETVGHTDQEIVGGVEARPNSHPWIVSLQQDGSHICGGSLVRVSATQEESDIVLTAAHCVYDGYFSVTATAGAHDLYRPTSAQVTARVTKAVYHPQYNPDTTLNDIAVLKLDKPIKFDTSVAGACGQSSGMRRNLAPQRAGGNTRVPVCLPASGERVAENTMATVAGWGLTREGGSDTSSILLQVGVPVLRHQDVANSYRSQKIFIDENAMLGAGYKKGGKDACQGDSGGPLVVKGSQGYVLQGIVSFGVGCARAGLPGIYTRVSNYIPWIHKQIRSLSAVR